MILINRISCDYWSPMNECESHRAPMTPLLGRKKNIINYCPNQKADFSPTQACLEWRMSSFCEKIHTGFIVLYLVARELLLLRNHGDVSCKNSVMRSLEPSAMRFAINRETYKLVVWTNWSTLGAIRRNLFHTLTHLSSFQIKAQFIIKTF